ncbi:hypothetical protein Tco_0867332 [Tanacetum coccineum]
MPSEYQQDYKKTRSYAPKIYNDPNMSDSFRDIYRALESRYVHEGRIIDPSFYNNLSDDSVAKFTVICICIYSDAWGLNELEKTIEQIEPYNSRLHALDDIRNLIHRRAVHEKIDKEGNTIYKLPNQIETSELFDHLRPCKLVIRENVYSAIGNRDRTQAVIALLLYCLENGQPCLLHHNGDLPSTKLSPRSYHRALKDNPNMSTEKRETRGMFKNLGRALHNIAQHFKDVEERMSLKNDLFVKHFNCLINVSLDC